MTIRERIVEVIHQAQVFEANIGEAVLEFIRFLPDDEWAELVGAKLADKRTGFRDESGVWHNYKVAVHFWTRQIRVPVLIDELAPAPSEEQWRYLLDLGETDKDS